MNSVPYVDELIREYLVFRGFTNTLNTFEADNKADKDRAFQSDKVSQHLLDLAATLEIESVLSYWRYLDLRLFSRLEEQYSPSVRHIEQELVRYCMIEGIARKKMGKVLACIEIYSSEMMHSAEWTRWFALPYLPEPEKTPYFRPYFSTQWQEAFRTSLRNFIDTVFKNMPLPGLLNFGADFINRQNLQAEIRNLKANIRTLHNKLEKSSIESKAIQQRLEATVQEQDSLRRSASAKSQDRPTSIHLPRGAADNAGEGGERALQPSSLPSGGQPSNHSAEPEIMMAVRDATADLADIRSIQSVSSNATAEDIPYAVVSQEIYQEHTAEVVSARFSTDGNLIASFDTDGIVK
ncbi:hypothetical protein IWQ60_004624 [Tieghemiomyces parasiticus]|uniref:ARMC9 CTLH-like domain-containing protein n=1 Tax=Tieghemiomyces parasiticus TaxID=78921 RepID=A0A9W8AFK0_9FUNG|nr:hypothetical protein IWQ60_004624 [Tieghemiomyces parasiticus]